MSFHQKLESIQYNACSAITGSIRGTSKEKLYQEIGLESLQLRCGYRKLGMFYKIFKSKSPQCLFKLIIPEKHHHMSQEMLQIFLFLISSTTFIIILSFHRRSLNGTT